MTDYDQQYKKTTNVFGSDPEKILVKYFLKSDRSEPILDLGSGQGRNSCFLAQNGYDVIALDPSLVAIDYVASQARQLHLPVKSINTSFAQYSAVEAPFSAILIFGLIQILSWTEIQLLISKIKAWTHSGSLVFITAFSTLDTSYQKYKLSFNEIERNSFRKGSGEIRTFLSPGQIVNLFDDYEILHHWEGLGAEHNHGDGVFEQHAMVEAVFKSHPDGFNSQPVG